MSAGQPLTIVLASLPHVAVTFACGADLEAWCHFAECSHSKDSACVIICVQSAHSLEVLSSAAASSELRAVLQRGEAAKRRLMELHRGMLVKMANQFLNQVSHCGKAYAWGMGLCALPLQIYLGSIISLTTSLRQAAGVLLHWRLIVRLGCDRAVWCHLVLSRVTIHYRVLVSRASALSGHDHDIDGDPTRL